MPYFPVEQQAKEYQGPATNQIRVANAPPSHIGLPRDADSGSTILAKPSDTMKTDLGSLSKVASASCGVMKYAAKGKPKKAPLPDFPFIVNRKKGTIHLGTRGTAIEGAHRHPDPGVRAIGRAALRDAVPSGQVELLDELRRQGIEVGDNARFKAHVGDFLQNPMTGMLLPMAPHFIPTGKDDDGNPTTLGDKLGPIGDVALMAAPMLYHGPLDVEGNKILGATSIKTTKAYKKNLAGYKKRIAASRRRKP